MPPLISLKAPVISKHRKIATSKLGANQTCKKLFHSKRTRAGKNWFYFWMLLCTSINIILFTWNDA